DRAELPRRVREADAALEDVVDLAVVEAHADHLPEDDPRFRARVDHLAGRPAALVDDDADALELRCERGLVVERDELEAAVERLDEVPVPRLLVSPLLDEEEPHEPRLYGLPADATRRVPA